MLQRRHAACQQTSRLTYLQPNSTPNPSFTQYNQQYIQCVWLVAPDSVIGGQVPVEIRNLCSIGSRSAGHIHGQLPLLQACLPSPSLLLLPLLLLVSLMVDAPPRQCAQGQGLVEDGGKGSQGCGGDFTGEDCCQHVLIGSTAARAQNKVWDCCSDRVWDCCSDRVWDCCSDRVWDCCSDSPQ